MTVRVSFEPSAFREIGDQTLENRPHRLCHPQGIRRKFIGSSCGRGHFPQPAGELDRRQFISSCHRTLKLSSAACIDHLVEGRLSYAVADGPTILAA